MSKHISLSLPRDSTTLYLACRSTDADEQAAAYRSLWDYLLPILASMVRNQPDASDLAEDCAQQTLIRIHQRLHECHEAAAFLRWSRRVARNLTIDELRRRGRFTTLPEDDAEVATLSSYHSEAATPEKHTLALLATEDLRALLDQSPMSERSRRLVIGRFIDDVTDEVLAEIESKLVDGEVLPSHVQVTRAKNLTKLRDWSVLHTYFNSGYRKNSG